MDCPQCKTEMDKDYINTKDKKKITYFVNWYCQKCGHRDYSQHDVVF